MKHFIFLFNTLFLLCSFTFLSCKNISKDFETESITFKLPQVSDFIIEQSEDKSFPRASSVFQWQIEVFSAQKSETFYTNTPTLYFEVQKNTPLCILATPIITISPEDKQIIFFKPAGAIYPYSDFELSWEGGFSATLMKQLFLNAKENNHSQNYVDTFITSFNWKKFMETINQKSQENPFYNPWQIDSTSLLEELSYGQFKSSLLTPKGVYTIEIPEELSKNKYIFSNYVPEIKAIFQFKKISVQKDCINSFLIDNNFLALVSCSSAKNISLTKVSLPIINLEL